VLTEKGFRKISMVMRLPIINMKRRETLTYGYTLYENVKQLVTHLIKFTVVELGSISWIRLPNSGIPTQIVRSMIINKTYDI